jgi:hypothetical protein
MKRRYARRIRRGIIGARMAYGLMQQDRDDAGAMVFYVVDAFGGLTRQALYREFARLVVNDVVVGGKMISFS